MSGKDKNFHVLGGKGNLAGKSDFKRRVKKKEVNDSEIELFNYYDKNGNGKLSKSEMECIFNDISGYIQRYDDDTVENQKKKRMHEVASLGHDSFHEIERYRIKLRREGKSDEEIEKLTAEMMRRKSSGKTSGKQKDDIDETLDLFEKYMKRDFKQVDKVQQTLYQFEDVNSSFTPKEIKQYLKDRGLDGKVRIVDVVNFINRMSLESNANALKNRIQKDDDSTLNAIRSLPAENAVKFIQEYGSGWFTNSIFRDIKHTDNSKEGFNIVGDKLEQQAVMMGLPAADVKAFREEYNKLAADGKIKKLNKLVNNLAKQLEPYEKTFHENRNGILEMMANDNISSNETNKMNRYGEYTSKFDYVDKYGQLNDIMYYAQKNNPKPLLEEIANSTKYGNDQRDRAQNLLDSKLLDYYPILTASLIARESLFGAHNEYLYKSIGNGTTQLTSIIIKDMYEHPEKFDKSLIAELNKTYPNARSLIDTINNPNTDTRLNLEVGTLGMKGKLRECILAANTITTERGIAKGIDYSRAENLLEFMLLNYNGNKGPAQADSRTQERYDYSQVIYQRFDKYLPEDIRSGHYFEYNPKNGRFVNH